MNIVEATLDDISLEEAVSMAGVSGKTLRRAVQDDQLPRRYVLGPRGPQLVFSRPDLAGWLDQRRIRADAAVGRRGRPLSRPTRTLGSPLDDLAVSMNKVAQLQVTLEKNQSTMADLMERLTQQAAAMLEAQATIQYLASKLTDLEAGIGAATPGRA